MPSETLENTGERSYVAFISYRHKELDREAAVRIQKKIENYVVPKEYRDKVGGKKLGVCFRDEDELPASSSLSDSITYALDHTQFLIVICTPDLPLSKWCLQEITYFLRTHDRDHVLAVLVDGSPEESFPEPLRFSYDDEGRMLAEVEPLAANIAGENHSINNKAFKKEVVRLFAAIIGCPFDALWQRERRAKTNRLIAAGGVVIAAMAVFLGVVLSKNAQISEQNSQILEQNDQIREQMAQISEQKDQISEQKDQISDQNLQLQRQMSTVLVDSGTIQLESYDWRSALNSALEAIKSNDPTVYDHRAEKLMADALGSYSNQDPQCFLLSEQNTEIQKLIADAEGKTLITADDLGAVRAFDAVSGELRWEFSTGSLEAPRLYLVNAHGIVICKNYKDCIALSLEDGSIAWQFNYTEPSAFQVLSEDESIFVVMDRGMGSGSERRSDLFFLDTADGHVLQQIQIPCDGFHVRTTYSLDYFYHYAGDLSADKKTFVFAVPVEDEDENAAKRMIFYAADLTEGTARRIGSFTQVPDIILSMAYYETENSAYCAMSDGHHLYSVVFPLDPGKEILNENYDYSLSSRSGFAAYDYMLRELPYLPPLNNEELSIVFSRNVIYLMNLNNGKMRNTINLDSAILHAEWVDKEEEIFQIFTESGWSLKYDVSHYENKAIESMYGVKTAVNGVQKAFLVKGGTLISPEDGRIFLTRQDAPTQVVLSKTVSDVSISPLDGRKLDSLITYAALSPSGERLMVFSQNTEENTLFLETCDLSTGTWSSPLKLPFYVYSGEYTTSVLIADDDHVVHEGIIYGTDGSTKDLNGEFPEHLNYRTSSACLLSDGSLLCTCESRADFGGYRLSGISVLSCLLNGTRVEDCETLADGLALQNDSDHPHLYAAGSNGWIAAWGTLAYLDEKIIQKTYDETMIAVKNVRTGEKFVLEECLKDVPVSKLILSNTKPLLLAIYETGDFQLFDLSQKGGRSLLNASYAHGELVSSAFSDQDSYLLFLTEMDWVDCFDTATGEMIYSKGGILAKPEGKSFMFLHARELPEEARLIVQADYSYDVSGSAVVLDTEAWVPTADIPNCLGLSLNRRTVIVGSSKGVSACPFYTIKDLAEQARERLR